MIAATGALVLALAGIALAGSFNYTLTSVANDSFATRNVSHDYTYLSSSVGGAYTTCLARGGGVSFCATTAVSHSYGDSCGTCLSYYKQKSGGNADISAYDEWTP